MKEIKNIFFLAFILIMLAPLPHFGISPIEYASVYAQTNDECADHLNSAETEYQAGKWKEAIDLINQCLSKPNLSEIEKGKAYRILSLVYIAMQSEKDATDAITNLLISNPTYKIDPSRDPQILQNFIDDIAPALIPEITFIMPDSKTPNEDGFTMTVTGLNFTYGSEVRFNGKAKSTIFISDTALQAQIPASDLLKEYAYDITVYSPILNGRISNAKRFVVETSSSFLWKWIAAGSAAIAFVVATVLLLTPPSGDTTIADPPARP